MATIWLISDTHFHHANILKFTWKPRDICTVCNGMGSLKAFPHMGCDTCDGTGYVDGSKEVRIRPEFDNLDQMHDAIVTLWNESVKPGHKVYHLGDVSFAQNRKKGIQPEDLHIVQKLHGELRLIPGNHDDAALEEYAKVGFDVRTSRKKFGVLLSHYPVHASCLEGTKGNVHGHIHQNPSPAGKYLNVSVEVTGYKPVLLDEAIAKLEKL